MLERVFHIINKAGNRGDMGGLSPGSEFHEGTAFQFKMAIFFVN